jgi:hypothetical protein
MEVDGCLADLIPTLSLFSFLDIFENQAVFAGGWGLVFWSSDQAF